MTIRMGQPEGVVLRHLEHLKVRNLRRQTIYNRQQVLWRLRCWAGGPVLYLDEHQLADWQRTRAAAITPGALRMEMSGVREFYRWAVRERYREDDPTIRLDMPRVLRRRPRPIRDALLRSALEQADASERAMLALAGFAGLRACEIAQLDWSEVDLVNATVTVVDGKGGRNRLLPMSSALAGILGDLPDRRGPVVRRLDGGHGPNPAHRVSSRANTYLHSKGITETLHQLRHRFASSMYRSCRDIRAVQDAMGHASPTTTAIYTDVPAGVSVQAIEDAGRLAA